MTLFLGYLLASLYEPMLFGVGVMERHGEVSKVQLAPSRKSWQLSTTDCLRLMQNRSISCKIVGAQAPRKRSNLGKISSKW